MSKRLKIQHGTPQARSNGLRLCTALSRVAACYITSLSRIDGDKVFFHAGVHEPERAYGLQNLAAYMARLEEDKNFFVALKNGGAAAVGVPAHINFPALASGMCDIKDKPPVGRPYALFPLAGIEVYAATKDYVLLDDLIRACDGIIEEFGQAMRQVMKHSKVVPLSFARRLAAS